MNSKRYRIISDGTALGTKIIQPDGREMDVSSVTKVEWTIEGAGIGIARLTLFNVEVDVVGSEPSRQSEDSLDDRTPEVNSSDASRP